MTARPRRGWPPPRLTVGCPTRPNLATPQRAFSGRPGPPYRAEACDALPCFAEPRRALPRRSATAVSIRDRFIRRDARLPLLWL
jgi:hypothetical protein